MQLKWPMLWDLFSLFPAHAGVILLLLKRHSGSASFPRTRGGDPSRDFMLNAFLIFSPHTRG